jgi:hypothetical protein
MSDFRRLNGASDSKTCCFVQVRVLLDMLNMGLAMREEQIFILCRPWLLKPVIVL